MGGRGGRVFKNIYKRHMDKTKGVRIKGGSGDGWGQGGVVERKWRQQYLNNNINK